METEVIKQIIESITLFVTPIATLIIAYFMSKSLLKYKNNVTREISLLNDIIFFRTVIELYKTKVDEHENKNFYNTFREEARKLTEIEPSDLSKPSSIKSRLKYLNEIDDKVEKLVSKFDKRI